MDWSRPVTAGCQGCSATWNGGLTLTPRSMMSTRWDPSVSPCARLIRRSTRCRKRTSTRSSAPPDPPEMRSIFGLHWGRLPKSTFPLVPKRFCTAKTHRGPGYRAGPCIRAIAEWWWPATERRLTDQLEALGLRRLGPEPVGPAHRHRSLRAGSPGFVDVVGRPHDQGCDFRRVRECDEGLTA